jgi:UDP-N-acetylmuramoylalanine--D-glutamate ligase
MDTLQDTPVLVLGLGESGLAMARWAARAGARVQVWDSRETPPNAAALRAQVPSATLLGGALDQVAVEPATLVLKSPGLAPNDPRIAPFLAVAAAQGLRVANELDLFVRALAELRTTRDYAPKIVAITGTNGKTTTTAMAAQLIERTGLRVAMAGNIGPTLLQTLADALDADALPEVWVLELSSFQLDGVDGFEPDAATVLNLTQDHLDWHGSMAAYAAAKGRVFGERAVMVVNRDDPMVEQLVRERVARPMPKPARGRAARPVERRIVRFGLTPPQVAGDFGLSIENGMAWLVRAMPSDDTARRSPRAAAVAAPADDLVIQRLMPADALRVRGRHNAANALAALALATAIGCPLAPMLHGLREYGGEPHRVEHIATLDGVDAFDDSKGTNVGATVAALNGLGDDKAPAKLVVILGGDGKGQDFGPLVEPVRRHVRAVATIGRDAEAIEAVLAPTGVPLERHASLEAATRWCFGRARGGDAVLLSPACASLDMFRNYGHRAEVFAAEVQAIAAEHGVVA